MDYVFVGVMRETLTTQILTEDPHHQMIHIMTDTEMTHTGK